LKEKGEITAVKPEKRSSQKKKGKKIQRSRERRTVKSCLIL